MADEVEARPAETDRCTALSVRRAEPASKSTRARMLPAADAKSPAEATRLWPRRAISPSRGREAAPQGHRRQNGRAQGRARRPTGPRRGRPGSSACARAWRARRRLTGIIAGVFTKRKLDEETLQDLEDLLIQADLGVETALRVTDALSPSRYGKEYRDDDVRASWPPRSRRCWTPVAMPLRARPLAQAACHPRRRRQRHRQDHDHRQARRQAHRGRACR